MPVRSDPYAWYVGRVWRYHRGGQNPSIQKGQKTNYKMTSNNQHQSSPKSTLSVSELELNGTTNTTSSASYHELHPEKLTVGVSWERPYLIKDMVPPDLSSDFPYA